MTGNGAKKKLYVVFNFELFFSSSLYVLQEKCIETGYKFIKVA